MLLFIRTTLFTGVIAEMPQYATVTRKDIFYAMGVSLTNSVDWDGHRGKTQRDSNQLNVVENHTPVNEGDPIEIAHPSASIIQSSPQLPVYDADEMVQIEDFIFRKLN
jgi:hypothetical protein